MSILGVWCKRLALALIVASAATVALRPARAQMQGVAAMPQTPPQGAWGEVIMANKRWMVVQNQLGQQFPIDMQAVTQFLIRWPSRLDALTAQSVVEAIGPDQGNNTLATDHIDFFEGADRELVQPWPSLTSLLPNGRPLTTIDPSFSRFMNAFDVGSQNLMYGWAFPVGAGLGGGTPAQLHVVGPVLQVAPLQISTPGNNFATVVSDGGMTISRVTKGTTAFAEKGDLVFLMPKDITPKTVVLSQAVLYKNVPITRYRFP